MTDTRTKTYSKTFCPNAKLPRFIPQVVTELTHSTLLTDVSILDFGCGKDQYWVRYYREHGYNIDGCDLSLPNKVTKSIYDVVMLSNVVNVQETVDQLQELFKSVTKYKPAKILFNYPASPRKLGLTKKDMLEMIRSMVEIRTVVEFEKECFSIEPYYFA
jgi:hypothetical protein